jgi:hypothetical protein
MLDIPLTQPMTQQEIEIEGQRQYRQWRREKDIIDNINIREALDLKNS